MCIMYSKTTTVITIQRQIKSSYNQRADERTGTKDNKDKMVDLMQLYQYV